MKVAGKKVRWETETTEAKRPERIAFRSVESPFPFEIPTPSSTPTAPLGSARRLHRGVGRVFG